MAKILLADDDVSIRGFLCAALEKTGHETVACPDGLAAWEAFQQAPASFDLLLTDIVMPGLDGLELAGRAKRLSPDLKIIFITGFAAMAADAPEGADKVVSKPFHLGSLVREIEDILKS